MLNEISQTQKGEYSMIPFIGGTQKRQTYRSGKYNRIYKRLEERVNAKLYLMGMESIFGLMKAFWKQ